MKNNSLLFLPDISGFTRFVFSTEINHSRHIISEILELLLDTNTLNLTLAEIEGDALFFYHYQNVPKIEKLLHQISRMTQAFEQYIAQYENQRVCNCGACSTAMDLKIKYIVHTGEFEFMNVKDISKPYGYPVIKAHQLLKNNVPINDYVLFSKEAIESTRYNTWDQKDKLHWIDTPFDAHDPPENVYYSKLENIINLFPKTNAPDYFIEMLNLNIEINADSNKIFDLISLFEHRTKWNGMIKELQYDATKENKVGESHICILKTGERLEIDTINLKANEEAMTYGERAPDMLGYKNVDTLFTVTPNGNSTSVSLKLITSQSDYNNNNAKAVKNRILKFMLNRELKKLKILAESE